MNRMMVVLSGFFLALIALSSSVFVVDQKSHAIVFSFGEVKSVVSEPGLHFKLPLIQNVVFFDKRILTIDSSEADRFITAEKKNILVDSYVKWRISDPKVYFVSFGDKNQRAEERLSQIVKAALNEVITKHSIRDVISGERAKVMDSIKARVSEDARQIGVSIIDVRLKRVDYVEQINNSVYDRMRAERTRVANELRSTGAAESEQIRADADRQRMVILADANRQSEEIRGAGDAEASQIYAQAFGQNPEFYKFYKSLEAYRSSFKNKSDLLVVDPASDFFRYFKGSGAAAQPAKSK